MVKIEGIVLQDNLPLSDAVVTVVEGSQPFHDIASLTDSSGAFTLELLPGTYLIRAYHDDRETETTIEVRPNQSEVSVRLRF
ncbi:MAG: carboxypeptidase regulatory-like domain-containing protein [Saprospiraceae bacterium]|nr:carboxypeptidase regulatory-like domain-containing protein [Saprospiraceae bacterium]